MARPRELPVLWRPLPLLGLWIVAGLSLSTVTGRVRDWFDMTDELRYERLAISIARTHSLIPRIHGVDVQSFSQLYPALIAPIFAHGLVPHDVVQAHVFNAWLMSSVCIPAYLLARNVTGSRRWAYLIAALSVFMPWIVYSTMLMTEVAAYPAFAWALLAIHRATVRPSARADLIALLGLALAFLGRTELIVLVFVPPPAIAAYEIGRATGPRRLAAGLGAAIARHRVLAAAYAVLLAAGIAVYVEGKISSVFGVYGAYAHENALFPAGLAGSFATHVALFSVGFGILPFLVGAAWLSANVIRPGTVSEQHAFACVGGFALLGIMFQGTNFDVRYTGFVHDRFLLYLAPLVLIATACAVRGERRPRWSLLAPVLLAVCGFATGSFPDYTWKQFATLTQDSPMSSFLHPIAKLAGGLTGARVLLIAVTLALAALFLAGTFRLDRRRLALATAGVAAVAMPAITIATFSHFFGTNGWSGRPVTQSQAGVYDWIDRQIGTNASVTEVPYLVSSDWFVSEQRWRDIEWSNKSIIRDALDPGAGFAYTGIWFPKLQLQFDPATGRANISPTEWAAVSDKDTRFALAGTASGNVQDVQLVKVDQPWRAQWLSLGLYDDGWTQPGVTARIRIFPTPGQQGAQKHFFVFAVRPPEDVGSRPVEVVSNVDRWTGTVSNTGTTSAQVNVCVPPSGYTEISISTPDSSAIPGDVASLDQSLTPRTGGVFFGFMAVSAGAGAACKA